MSDNRYLIRLAEKNDDDFILALAPRLVDFSLPTWRRRHECMEVIRESLRDHLEKRPEDSYIFVAENVGGERIGFIHLQKTYDLFSGCHNAHIADLAVAAAHEGHGAGRALLDHAERWAREHLCQLLTLAVFPGNQPARALYDTVGFETDLLWLAKPVR